MRIAALDFGNENQPNLELQLSKLALESEAVNNVIDTFRNTLPGLLSNLLTQYSSLGTKSDIESEVQSAKLHFGNLKIKLAHSSFLNHGSTLVSVPEGFEGNFLEYVELLSSMSVSIFQEANKTLGEYNFVLSSFITNKENKISLKDHSDLYVQIKNQRENFTKQLGTFFPTDKNVSKAKLKTVINRFTDLEPLLKSAENLNKQRKAQNLKEISSAIEKTLDLLKIIISDTENNGISKVSGNSAINISTGAYEIGKFVEFIAIYRFKVEQIVFCIEKLLKTLDTTV